MVSYIASNYNLISCLQYREYKIVCSPILWCSLRFPHEYDVRLVFISFAFSYIFFALIYAYWSLTRLPYYMMFVSFKSHVALMEQELPVLPEDLNWPWFSSLGVVFIWRNELYSSLRFHSVSEINQSNENTALTFWNLSSISVSSTFSFRFILLSTWIYIILVNLSEYQFFFRKSIKQ